MSRALNILQEKRLLGEKKILEKSCIHYFDAYFDENDKLTWYFLIKGQKGTHYENGEYIGKIIHSSKYPIEPPSYYMLTPSGRFEANKEICLTNSRFHKGEWTSSWNIVSILIAFYSVFSDDFDEGVAHIKKSKEERSVLANDSIEYNNKNFNSIYNKFNRTYLKDEL